MGATERLGGGTLGGPGRPEQVVKLREPGSRGEAGAPVHAPSTPRGPGCSPQRGRQAGGHGKAESHLLPDVQEALPSGVRGGISGCGPSRGPPMAPPHS